MAPLTLAAKGLLRVAPHLYLMTSTLSIQSELTAAVFQVRLWQVGALALLRRRRQRIWSRRHSTCRSSGRWRGNLQRPEGLVGTENGWLLR